MFSENDLQNLLKLINLAPIKGSDAPGVVLLQQKIISLIKNANENKTAGKGDSESAGPEVDIGELQENRGS